MGIDRNLQKTHYLEMEHSRIPMNKINKHIINQWNQKEEHRTSALVITIKPITNIQRISD